MNTEEKIERLRALIEESGSNLWSIEYGFPDEPIEVVRDGVVEVFTPYKRGKGVYANTYEEIDPSIRLAVESVNYIDDIIHDYDIIENMLRIYVNRVLWLAKTHPDIYEQMLEGAVSGYN